MNLFDFDPAGIFSFTVPPLELMLRGDAQAAPFRYRNLGKLATIGRRAGIADFGWISFRGPLPGGFGASFISTS